MTRLHSLLLGGLVLSACVTAPPPKREIGMSLREAQQVVAAFEQTLSKSDSPEPLREPKSLDDVLEILKRDQLELFPAGVAFAHSQSDLKAKALESQIEFAWGEAQLDLATLMGRVANHQRDQLRALQDRKADGALSEEETKTEQELGESLTRNEGLITALPLLAAEHVANGVALSKELITAQPDDYIGYRLTADYYRLRGSWAEFDQMVTKIEATNPKSNGLVFLRAMREIEHADHVEEGRALLQQALTTDPQFVRAQAALVRTAPSLDEKHKSLLALEKLSPRHQMVVWAGPSIKAAYQSLLRARKGKTPTRPH